MKTTNNAACRCFYVLLFAFALGCLPANAQYFRESGAVVLYRLDDAKAADQAARTEARQSGQPEVIAGPKDGMKAWQLDGKTFVAIHGKGANLWTRRWGQPWITPGVGVSLWIKGKAGSRPMIVTELPGVWKAWSANRDEFKIQFANHEPLTIPSATVLDGKWHHLAFTCDFSDIFRVGDNFNPRDMRNFIMPFAVELNTPGQVAKVEYYDGAQKLGESTQAPFAFTASELGRGHHFFTARVTDKTGASSISAPATVDLWNDGMTTTRWVGKGKSGDLSDTNNWDNGLPNWDRLPTTQEKPNKVGIIEGVMALTVPGLTSRNIVARNQVSLKTDTLKLDGPAFLSLNGRSELVLSGVWGLSIGPGSMLDINDQATVRYVAEEGKANIGLSGSTVNQNGGRFFAVAAPLQFNLGARYNLMAGEAYFRSIFHHSAGNYIDFARGGTGALHFTQENEASLRKQVENGLIRINGQLAKPEEFVFDRVTVDGVAFTRMRLAGQKTSTIIAKITSPENGKSQTRMWLTRCFVDGRNVANGEQVFVDAFDGTAPLCIGAGAGGQSGFSGAVADFAVFERPLMSSDAVALAANRVTDPPARAPHVLAGHPRVLLLEKGALQVSTVLDRALVDGTGEIRLKWAMRGGPAPVLFENATAIQTKATFSKPGTYVLELAAEDGKDKDVNTMVVHVVDPVAVGLIYDQFKRPPAPGVHPRVYINPEDLPELRRRYKETASGKAALGILQEATAKMRASKDYQALVAGDVTAGGKWPPVFDKIALLALITEDGAMGQEVAKALATHCLGMEASTERPVRRGKEREWSANGVFDQFGRGDVLTLGYDLAYPFMTDEQRRIVRRVIAKAAWGQYTSGMNFPPYTATSNWQSYHVPFLMTAQMAIEGEEGCDADVLAQCMESMSDFVNYSAMPDGAGWEPYGPKGGDGVGVYMVALAKRGNYAIANPHLREAARYLYYIAHPYGTQATLVGLGDNGVANFPCGYYGMKTMKIVYPRDPMIDTAYFRGWRGRYHSDIDTAGLLFPMDFMNYQEASVELPAAYGSRQGFGYAPSLPDNPVKWDKTMPLVFTAPYSGEVNMRSEWSEEAVWLHVPCYQHLVKGGGHITAGAHANPLLDAIGRSWVSFKLCKEPEGYNYILVDGKGDSKALPARLMGVTEFKEAAFAVTDMLPSYDPAGVATDTLTINTFLDKAAGVEEWMRMPIQDLQPGGHVYFWANFGRHVSEAWYWPKGGGNRKGANPTFQRAFRTAGLVRGARPYVLVIDDFQKDQAMREYKWCMSLLPDIASDIEGYIRRNGNDLVMLDPQSGGEKRMLIRLLNCTAPVEYEFPVITKGNPSAQVADSRALVIKTKAVAPDFRLLFYPHRRGDALPVTTWTPEALTVSVEGQKDTLKLAMENGRTVVKSLEREGQPFLSAFAGEDRVVCMDQPVALNAAGQARLAADAASSKKVKVSWSVVSKPEGAQVSLTPENALETNAVFNKEGAYVLELKAKAGRLESRSKVTLTVRATKPPTLWYPLDGQEPVDATGNTKAKGLAAGTVDGPRPGTKAAKFTGTERMAMERNALTDRLGFGNGGCNNLTVSAWLRMEPGSTARELMIKHGQWRIMAEAQATYFSPWGGEVWTPSDLWTDGAWHHMAVSYDYGKTNRNVKIYRDGVLIKVASATFKPDRLDLPMVFGGGLKGTMADFVIFDHALDDGGASEGFGTQGELRMLYERGPKAFMAK